MRRSRSPTLPPTVLMKATSTGHVEIAYRFAVLDASLNSSVIERSWNTSEQQDEV
jgi:hypothetical protein